MKKQISIDAPVVGVRGARRRCDDRQQQRSGPVSWCLGKPKDSQREEMRLNGVSAKLSFRMMWLHAFHYITEKFNSIIDKANLNRLICICLCICVWRKYKAVTKSTLSLLSWLNIQSWLVVSQFKTFWRELKTHGHHKRMKLKTIIKYFLIYRFFH